VALTDASPSLPPAAGWHRGFWLTRQRPVWVRVGTPADGHRFSAGLALHDSLALPGVLPLFAAEPSPTPFFAVPQVGEPSRRGLRALRGEPALVLAAARAGVEVLNALALAGVLLPDAALERFLCDSAGHLALADLAGARADAPAVAREAHLSLARTLVIELLDVAAGRHAFATLRRAAGDAVDLLALARIFALGE
jgi:hypothetical protein